jgi:hypothetical protein
MLSDDHACPAPANQVPLTPPAAPHEHSHPPCLASWYQRQMPAVSMAVPATNRNTASATLRHGRLPVLSSRSAQLELARKSKSVLSMRCGSYEPCCILCGACAAASSGAERCLQLRCAARHPTRLVCEGGAGPDHTGTSPCVATPQQWWLRQGEDTPTSNAGATVDCAVARVWLAQVGAVVVSEVRIGVTIPFVHAAQDGGW